MVIYRYVRIEGDDYVFPGMCPSAELLESRVERLGNDTPADLSRPFIQSILNRLDEGEKAVIREAASSLKAKTRLRSVLNDIYGKDGLNLLARKAVAYELCL